MNRTFKQYTCLEWKNLTCFLKIFSTPQNQAPVSRSSGYRARFGLTFP